MAHTLPRLVVAGLAGDSGKTLVSLGLIRAFRNRGLRIAPFKKGPDFIDAAWLGAAAGLAGRNLDTFLMSKDAILESLSRMASSCDLAIIEGNRGLFDGMDAEGSHSTAQLAILTGSPVVLVVDATKATRTLAALVLGCQKMDPEVPLAGVILNRVGTRRQESVAREAIAATTGLPVLGAIPRIDDQHLPSRHLGLVTSVEHAGTEEALEKVSRLIQQNVDLSSIQRLGEGASGLTTTTQAKTVATQAKNQRVRVGILKDRAFSFYYPENLACLEEAGAELWPISPIEDDSLPEIDALYAGGGFPEVYAAELSANQSLRNQLAARIDAGLPVWAECGGLMYLSRAIVADGASYPMVGSLPAVVEQTTKPQGHGYVQAQVDTRNPFLGEGTQLRGHEFHYSKLTESSDRLPTTWRLERGFGLGNGRDGIQVANVMATYTHLHALGEPAWATSLVAAGAGRQTISSAGGLS
jgi:cobyrinic acid a,c-diamide synthase